MYKISLLSYAANIYIYILAAKNVASKYHTNTDNCWRSLSIKFNYQINKEKDPNEIKI